MSSKKKLSTPLTEEAVRSLKAGDEVLLSGVITTARDAAHKYLLEGGDPPVALEGAVLYHCGPVVRQIDDGWEIVAAGPTTSARLSLFTPEVIERFGVRAAIGKGGMDKRTLEAMQKLGAVYFSAVGGAAAVLANAIKKVRNVYMLEKFGVPEAFWEAEIEDLPLIVTMDSHGRSIHDEVKAVSEEIYLELMK